MLNFSLKKTNRTVKTPQLVTLQYPNSIISEQFRTIRSNLQFSENGMNLKTIGVTSSGPGEGKSTVSANLATVFADQKHRVLLIDADLRRPSIHRVFKKPNTKGLTSLLNNPNLSVEEVIHRSKIENLFLITSGPTPTNPSELLSSNGMDRLIKLFQKNFDLIIFDLPPTVAVTDAQIMATKVDGTILVVRNDVAYKDAVDKAVDLLRTVGANLVGFIFNGAERKTTDPYSYYGKD